MVVLHRAGVDTDLSVTHTDTDGAGVKSNITDTVDVSQGDLISVKFNESGGVVMNSNLYYASFEFK